MMLAHFILQLGGHQKHLTVLSENLRGYEEVWPEFSFKIKRHDDLPLDGSDLTGVHTVLFFIETAEDFQLFASTQKRYLSISFFAVFPHRNDKLFKQSLLNKDDLISYLFAEDLSNPLLGSVISKAYENVWIRKRQNSGIEELAIINKTLGCVLFKVAVEGKDSYRFVRVNRIFAERAGKSISEIEGRLAEEVFPAEGMKKIYKEFGRAVESQKTISWTMTMPFAHRDTAGVVTLTPHFDELGRCDYLIGSVKDQTEINKINEALRKSEQFLKTLFDNALSAILVVNDQGDFVSANKGALNLFGYSEAELLSMNIHDISASKDSEEVERVKNILEGNTRKGEFNLLTKEGERKVVIFQGDRMAKDFNVLAMTEITQRKQNELELMLRKERLDIAIDSSELGIIDWDFVTGEVKVEGKYYEIVGHDPSDYVPGEKSFLEKLLHPEDKERIVKVFKEILEGKTTKLHQTYRVISRQGDVRWLDFRGRVVRKEKKVIRLIGAIREITKEIEYESAMLNATINGQELARERISRDIHDGLQQTLVTAVINFQALKEQLLHLPQKYKDRFDVGLSYLNRGIMEARNVAYQLMPKSISQFGFIHTVENLMEDIEGDVKFSFSHNLKPSTRFPFKVEIALYRITQEAINNIYKHSKATVARIRLTYSVDMLTLIVEDNGCGIDPDDWPTHGTGFMSMKNRVTALGGTLDIKSTPGHGTCLFVAINLHHLREENDSAPSKPIAEMK